MTYKLGTRSLNSLHNIHPNLVKVMKHAITNSSIDFTIIEGVRTLKRQQGLYSQGRTKPGIKVTNADGIRNKSNHQVKKMVMAMQWILSIF